VLNVNLSARSSSRRPRCGTWRSGERRIVNVSSVIGEMGNIARRTTRVQVGAVRPTKTLARESAFLLAKAGRLADPDGSG